MKAIPGFQMGATLARDAATDRPTLTLDSPLRYASLIERMPVGRYSVTVEREVVFGVLVFLAAWWCLQ